MRLAPGMCNPPVTMRVFSNPTLRSVTPRDADSPVCAGRPVALKQDGGVPTAGAAHPQGLTLG